MKMHSLAPAHVTVESDLCSEAMLVKVTKAQKLFVERQSRAEMRTVANYIRTLIAEKMNGE
jgi:hypothetical protein